MVSEKLEDKVRKLSMGRFIRPSLDEWISPSVKSYFIRIRSSEIEDPKLLRIASYYVDALIVSKIAMFTGAVFLAKYAADMIREYQ